MLHVHMMIHTLNLILPIGVNWCIYNQCLQNNKQFRTKGMSPISTPTMLFYMNFPEPTETYIIGNNATETKQYKQHRKNNNKNYEYRNKHNLSKNITTHCKNYLFNTTF